MNIPRQLACAAACALAAAAPARALVIDSYSAAANDRFATNNPSAFIANGFNLSGVSRATNGAWVTMIAPNVFVGANHYAPAEGNTVTFYASNSATGPSVTRTVTGARQRILGTTDIFVGTLDAPLPEGYATYATATETVITNSGWDTTYRNAVLYHVGLSPGSYSGALDVAVGRNVTDRWFNQHTISPSTTWAFGAMYDTNGAANYQTYETKVSGDSGAPIFYDAGSNTFRLLGITWGTGTYGDGSVASIFTYLGNYTNEIGGFLATNALPSIPNTPAGFEAARISSFRVDLAWSDASAVETGYALERSTDGTNWSSLTNLPANTTTHSDITAPSSDAHYRLRAENGATAGDWTTASVLAPVPPGTPGNVVGAGTSMSTASLAWEAVAGASAIILERSATGNLGPWTLVSDAISGAATSFADTGLAANTTYWYRLRAANAIGNSPWSTVASATTLNTATLVNDPFTDGGVTDGTDALDTAWKKEATAQTVTTDSLLDSGTPANVMEVSTTTTEGDVYAYFTLPSEQTLAVGESLKLSFKLRHTGTPRADNGRTGFSLAYTPANSPWPGAGNREYLVRTSYGTSANVGYVARTADVQLVNSSGTDVTLGTGHAGINAGTDALAAWMEVERTADTSIRIRYQLGGGTIFEVNDTGAIITTFNRVFFRFRTTAGTTDPKFHLDDVTVTKTLAGTPAPSQHPITVWRDQYFGTTESTGTASDDFDADGDGIPNLVEYALGTLPGSAASHARPQLGTAANRLALTFTPEQTAGLRYIVEASDDLVTWTQTDITATIVEGQEHTHTDSADTSTTPHRFLRLRVSTE